MVTLDKEAPSVYSRVLTNIRISCKRDIFRKRFVIRWALIISVLVLVIKLLGKSNIKLDIQFGSDPRHEHQGIVEFKRDAEEVEQQREMLENLGGARPAQPAQPAPVQQVEQRAADPVKKEEELVHAYTGPTDQEPMYLDFIDRNEPWDKDAEKQSKSDWKLNKYLSDRLPLNRNTHDGRHPTCSERTYKKDMPTASVVLVFYNEALSVVLRTVFTVLKESEDRLIHEVLLYDDCSTIEELKEPLERHIAPYPKIRLVRAAERGGLVRARLFASRQARGDVLLYLDAHCEPTPGWLEPLLEPIGRDRTTVTMPSLDAINWEDLTYAGADTIWVIGGVNWLMNMLWAPIPPRETERRQKEDPFPITANLRTPTMAGGLFAMDRLYFKELGEYDEGMGVWGGENMELSFRIWMCGGSMLFVPCSKVGHIFRPSHPYDFMGNNGDVVSTNYIRAARVWFDDELDFFFKIRPQFKDKDVGDLTERHELRKRLNCKSYAWFIRNVFPELPLERDLLASGQFRTDEDRCMDTRGGDLSQGNALHLGSCTNGVNTNSNRFMMLTKENTLMGLNFCTDSGFAEHLQFHNCHHQGGGQKFVYDPATRRIRQDTGKCLTGDTKLEKVTMAPCVEGNKAQLWSFEFTYF